jgi:hypothetical protein
MGKWKLIGSATIAGVLLSATVAGAAGTFIDDDGHVFEGAIEAIAAEGITRGCNPPADDRYCPEDQVTRGQMAIFIVRAYDLPATSGDFFNDDSGKVYEDAANRLAQAGLTQGCAPSRYCGDDTITRGEMAAFLSRAENLPDSATDHFVDDNTSIFEPGINKVADARITLGCNPPANTNFCPNDNVTRGQMAGFLTRALGLTPIRPPAPPPPGSFVPFTVSGNGNDVINFRIPGDVPAVLDLTHDGSSNFIVWSLDSSFSMIDLLVNEIGSYQGRRMVHGGWFSAPELVRHLDIDADGAWSITARPMSATRSMTSSLNGTGDDIVTYDGSAPTLTSTHNGTSNYIVWGYESNGSIAGLIVNEIGAYSGTDVIPAGTRIFDVSADGNWTFAAP